MRKYLYLAVTFLLFQSSTVDASSCVIPLDCDGVPTWQSYRTNNNCMKSLSNDMKKIYQKELDELEGDVHAVENDLEKLKDKFESYKRMKTDVDECATSRNDCHTKSTCSNTMGSYTCTCNNGYTGNGKNCSDINECATDNNDCHGNSTCLNTPGSYTCTCSMGYTGDGKECLDIDECATGVNDCHEQASCKNTPGSFSCTCMDGYVGDGRNCSVSCRSGDILYNGTCYWIKLIGENSVGFKKAEKLCRDSGGTVANIYSREHYDMIISKIRSLITDSKPLYVYIGMKYDKYNNTLLNYDGTAAKFQAWRSGDPIRISGDQVLPVCIDVLPDPYSRRTGMLTSNKGWLKHGAVCMG